MVETGGKIRLPWQIMMLEYSARRGLYNNRNRALFAGFSGQYLHRHHCSPWRLQCEGGSARVCVCVCVCVRAEGIKVFLRGSL